MKKRLPIWLVTAIAVIAFAAGFLADRHYMNSWSGPDVSDSKVKTVLDLINEQYVDTVNFDNLMEKSIPLILRGLDPHTGYFDARDTKITRNHPDGVIPDLGVVLLIFNDTLHVECIVPAGPSDIAGIRPGDRIVKIDGEPTANIKKTSGEIYKRLSGPNGSKVTLSVERHGSRKVLDFAVTRNRIIKRTLDSYYMIDKNTGYVKVNQFERNTHEEFVHALSQLQAQGAKRFLIDLRGNGGGYMETAVLMANEFLQAKRPIVTTRGKRRQYSHTYNSDGKGKFQNIELAVLIDEHSASASEIFAGALQDNDRALIVGRRSFGKGLVQDNFILPDSSIIRLTVARYYTPSGRCIQKNYKHLETRYYEDELLERLKHGELFNRDSLRIDKNQAFTTRHGRTVYGGGGIIPDIFVGRDTTGISQYYVDVENAGLLQRFAFAYCEKNRSTLEQMSDYKQFLRTTPIDNDIIKEFAAFAAAHGIAPRWYYINKSRDLILTKIKAITAHDIFGPEGYSAIVNRNDKTVQEALKALNRHKAAFPITDEAIK
ncbi:MAG: S41 family peptidase [Muribaculaceae bacterium]|nr:S41 family peptidase [Muribaculaceae bacterium]